MSGAATGNFDLSISAAQYAPTYPFSGEFIDETHELISKLPREGAVLKFAFAGWLQIEDALKLYELAYFSDGDVLELGTYQGLSTYFIARGLLNSGRDLSCDTVELDPRASRQAYIHLDLVDLNCVVRHFIGDATEICKRLLESGQQYGFAFVDHSHGYEDVLGTNELLKGLIKPGGFALYHDFTDPRNSTRTGVGDHPDEFGVRHACEVAFADGSFRFLGICGACGLYQRAG